MRRVIVAIGIAAVSLTGFTACSGDDSSTAVSVDGTTAGDNDGYSDEMSQECLDVAMAYAAAIGAMGGSTAEIDWSNWISTMQSAVPVELKDSVAVWGAAMNDYFTVVAQHADDLTAPEVVAALEKVTTPEVQAASDAISAYFDNGCQS